MPSSPVDVVVRRLPSCFTIKLLLLLAAAGLLFIVFRAHVPEKSTFPLWAFIIAVVVNISTTDNNNNFTKFTRFFFIVFKFYELILQVTDDGDKCSMR